MENNTQNKDLTATFGNTVLGDSYSFSPNLKKFINKNPHCNKIFLDKSTNIWYIGYTDGKFFAGARFLSVLCNGSKTQIYAFDNSFSKRLVERTLQFWKCTAYFGRRMFPRWY